MPFTNLPYDFVKQLHLRSVCVTACIDFFAFFSSGRGTAYAEYKSGSVSHSFPNPASGRFPNPASHCLLADFLFGLDSRNPASVATPYVFLFFVSFSFSLALAFETFAAVSALCPASLFCRATVASCFCKRKVSVGV